VSRRTTTTQRQRAPPPLPTSRCFLPRQFLLPRPSPPAGFLRLSRSPCLPLANISINNNNNNNAPCCRTERRSLSELPRKTTRFSHRSASVSSNHKSSFSLSLPLCLSHQRRNLCRLVDRPSPPVSQSVTLLLVTCARKNYTPRSGETDRPAPCAATSMRVSRGIIRPSPSPFLPAASIRQWRIVAPMRQRPPISGRISNARSLRICKSRIP